jgi:tetratricopeptide (TPR) repeat protein
VASSWELLSAEEQEAMNACAAFAGPFDLAAAEALLGPSALDRLESLVDAAMVQVPSPGRFALLGFVADFVREERTPAERVRWGDRHVAWLLSQVPDVDVGRVPSELHPDLVAGAAFLVERGDPRAEALLLAVTIARPGRHAELLEEAARRFGSPAALRARARWRRLTGDAEGALRDLDEALRGSTDPRLRGRLLRELGVLHHARRDELAARRCYEEALALHRAAGDRRDEAVTTGNLGALDHDLCRYEEAEVHYEAALAGLRAAGDRRAEATFLANLAVLRQEQGDPRGAASGYSRALGLLEEAGDDRMVAITLGNIGLLQHELGELEAALASHQRAADRFAAVDDPASEALCRARLGAVACLLGLPAGPEALDRAERLAGISGDETTSRVVALFRGFEALAAGRASEVRRRLGEAQGLVDRSQDARVAARLLAAGIREEEVLAVGPDWFVAPGGARGELARYQSCLRMFEVLVERRLADPDGVLEIEDLFRAGWPGERISAASMRNRVHVNLARLRTLGLKAVLIRSGEGYRLDPAVRVEDRRGS